MDNFLEIVPSSCSPIRESSSMAQLNNNNEDKSLEIVPSSSSLIRELLLPSNTTPRRKVDNSLEIVPSSCSLIRELSVASGRNLDTSMAVDVQDLDRTSKSIGKKRKRHSKDLEIVEDSQPFISSSSSSSSARAQNILRSCGGANPVANSQ
ncbi:hypothetical protein BT96DRAFT_212205 [Gymnopus androsaceus JB14]|uniref:Uncharacterized protein n=1 Tax=Gymnopus androsaceus JB14 TaxID=1447944 RepID=A0A6A4H8T4_9AGAR|nr:hypothetical protein BT96DRAFT_212205 [Gymnopus androsaceus JB14]